MSLTLAEIAEHLDGTVIGNSKHTVDDVGTLMKATSNQLSFLSNPKYKKYLAETNAGVVIVARNLANDLSTSANLIEVDDPYIAYARAAALIKPVQKPKVAIHPSASIDSTAHIAGNVSIGPNAVIHANVVIDAGVRIDAGCVIDTDCTIGSDSWIKANVMLSHGTTIGQRAIIHPGVIIGADGFGIANDNGHWIKVPQLGAVVIGDDVEIGANTTVDRGAIEDTIIGDGVKLDNQIQIGHNVEIGAHTVMAGGTCVAGSTKIGRYCVIGGSSAITGHIEIADGVQLTGMSAVSKSLTEKGAYSSGIPVAPTREWHKNTIRYRQLDKLFERVKLLEKQKKD